MSDIDTREPEKSFIDVLGKRMAYVEMGEGDPILFQHGNPTSSYLWRNIMPPLADRGRCIALDLIGMGDSDKLDGSEPGSYRFVEHRRYFDAALEALGVTGNVTLVLHDWGSALGFDWAYRNPGRVRAICYMESIVMPVAWADWPESVRPIFETFRGPAGDDLVLQQNFFVEKVLPNGVLRGLTDAEMDVYRRPYLNSGEDRRPTLTWPREIPLDGEPADIHDIVAAYSGWLAQSADLPKLFINADPGVILVGRQRETCRRWPNQTEVTVAGSHFLQEDSPEDIAAAIGRWMDAL